jgi:hypothetical protein
VVSAVEKEDLTLFEFEAGADRGRLRFVEAVENSFGPLAANYGFSRVEATPTFVRYESPDRFVQVFHGRGSYELGVEFGPRASDDAPVNLNDLLAMHGEPPVHSQATSADLTAKLIGRLAEVARERASEIFGGEDSIDERVRISRAAQSDEMLLGWRLEDVRREVEHAWRQHDHQEVARLLESIEGFLTPAERRKLEYARKQPR